MRRVNFLARGVLVLSLVLALGFPTSARGRREEPPSKVPIFKVIKQLVLKALGDGLVTPIP